MNELTELNKIQLEKMIKTWNNEKLEALEKGIRYNKYTIESYIQEVENNLDIYKKIGFEDIEAYSSYVKEKLKKYIERG